MGRDIALRQIRCVDAGKQYDARACFSIRRFRFVKGYAMKKNTGNCNYELSRRTMLQGELVASLSWMGSGHVALRGEPDVPTALKGTGLRTIDITPITTHRPTSIYLLRRVNASMPSSA